MTRCPDALTTEQVNGLSLRVCISAEEAEEEKNLKRPKKNNPKLKGLSWKLCYYCKTPRNTFIFCTTLHFLSQVNCLSASPSVHLLHLAFLGTQGLTISFFCTAEYPQIFCLASCFYHLNSIYLCNCSPSQDVSSVEYKKLGQKTHFSVPILFKNSAMHPSVFEWSWSCSWVLN